MAIFASNKLSLSEALAPAMMKGSFEFNKNASCLDVWINFNHGEEKTLANGKICRTVPWSQISECHLKAKDGRTGKKNPERNTLYNMKHMCLMMNAAANIHASRPPSIAKMQQLYRSPKVQDILPKGETVHGRKRRFDELAWVYVARIIKRGEQKSRKRPSGTQLPIKKRRKQQKRLIPKGVFERLLEASAPSRPPPCPDGVAHDGDRQDSVDISTDSDDCCPRQNATIQCNSSDGDDVLAVADGPGKNFASFRKNKAKKVGANVFDCAGPIPEDEDLGRVKLVPGELAATASWGSLLTGSVTTGYCNLVANACRERHGFSVGRSETDVVEALRGHIKEYAKEEALLRYSQFLEEIGAGSASIEWKTDTLVVLQIFSGPRTSGHWAGLIIDRTHEADVAVFLDSLPSFSPNMFSDCKGLLLDAGIVDETCNWSVATVPTQAPGSMDCGVFMCCTAVAYIQALMSNGMVGSENKTTKRARPPSELVFHLPDGLSAEAWGKRARLHMIDTIQQEQFRFETFTKEVGGYFSFGGSC